jgi:hypothetical protein
MLAFFIVKVFLIFNVASPSVVFCIKFILILVVVSFILGFISVFYCLMPSALPKKFIIAS